LCLRGDFFIFLFTYVWKSVNIPVCLPTGKRKPPVGEGFAENRTFSYQQIHAHKPLFGNQGKVFNLGNLDFDIVSDLELRISDFSYRDTLHASRDTNITFTTVEDSLQIGPFLQNKANFRKSQMYVNKVLTREYDNETLSKRGKNKPNTKPKKPNLQ
jgi:hypothetical protein